MGDSELDTHLLSQSPRTSPTRHRGVSVPPVSATALKARKRLRQVGVATFTQLKAERSVDPGRPSLRAAVEYMNFFLPKKGHGPDGKPLLLPLGCSEAEFSEHMGVGVSLYFYFVKMTGWLFVAATVVALPKFVANARGHGLDLQWPWSSPNCPTTDTGLMGLVQLMLSTFSYIFFCLTLGNVSFGAGNSHGMWHLTSELVLSILFCVYVYFIGRSINTVLSSSENRAVRASDFAVSVGRLPSFGTDADSIREHFSFFGHVASVAMSNDNSEVLELLRRQHAYRTHWRHLHLEYSRARRALRSSSHSTSGVQLRAESSGRRRACERLLVRISQHMIVMLRGKEELRKATRQPSPCTGHAFVTFSSMDDAARCVSHFERIRRHEKSRGGVGDESVDFRQLYFRNVTKLKVSRAPEPSDIIWENLTFTKRQGRVAILKTTSFITCVACVSTVFITLTNISMSYFSMGLLTTLWSTPVIVISNVVIFILTPQLAIKNEKHHTRSSQHLHMLVKMTFFQVFNTVVATLAFLFLRWQPPTSSAPSCPVTPIAPLPDGQPCFSTDTAGSSFAPTCVKHWYTIGAAVLMNAVFGDMSAILGLIEFIRPDKLIIRYVVAPRCHTQAEMNRVFALDSDFYLPFRYQLVLKIVVIAFTFCTAIPLLLPFAALFMYLSYKVDRYNLLRVFKPPPRTTERTIAVSVLYILPTAVFGHIWFAIFFYSKQAGTPVPFVYYATLAFLAIYIMVRITAELRAHTQRPIRHVDEAQRLADDDDDGGLRGGRGRGGRGASVRASGYAPGGFDLAADFGGSRYQPEAETRNPFGAEAPNGDGLSYGGGPSAVPAEALTESDLRTHLDTIEMYVPPLSSTLLNSWYSNAAVSAEARLAAAGRQPVVTSSTRAEIPTGAPPTPATGPEAGV